MLILKRFLTPNGREKYSDIRKYTVERIPRLFNQVIGRDLRYFPQIKCRKEHLGSRYDGKCVCLDNITSDTIVYSFGIGRDISFDLAMIERFGVDVYAFDPTPISKNWLSKQNVPKKFHFFDYGVADYDGTAEFYPFWPDNPREHDFTIVHPSKASKGMISCPVYRLKTIMNKLGHQKIDILKMDIEGVEYSVINDFLESGLTVNQLLVEFHHRFDNIGLKPTDNVINLLNRHGFKIFNIGSDGQEYSFLRV